MPNETVQFLPRTELLTFEEITRFCRVATQIGVHRVRLTGGEPLVRNQLGKLIAMLRDLDGLDDLALTTNGLLLADQAAGLRAAGLDRLNISLDAISEDGFRKIARRDGLQQVLDGIETAQAVGFRKIRLNAVAVRGITEDEILPLVRFARRQRLELRFIEFMPLDAEDHWESDQVMSGRVIRQMVEAEFGALLAAPRHDPSQPAVDYVFADTAETPSPGGIGFINPVSQPFCDHCNRLRLTAEGQIRNCLFSTEEWDARQLLRTPESPDQQLARLIRNAVANKKLGHGIDTPQFVKPERAMYQIGG